MKSLICIRSRVDRENWYPNTLDDMHLHGWALQMNRTRQSSYWLSNSLPICFTHTILWYTARCLIHSRRLFISVVYFRLISSRDDDRIASRHRLIIESRKARPSIPYTASWIILHGHQGSCPESRHLGLGIGVTQWEAGLYITNTRTFVFWLR